MGKLSVGKILAFGWRWYVGEQLAFGKFDAVGTVRGSAGDFCSGRT